MSELERGRLDRTMGLLGTTSVGVGVIVGGGILALTGVASAATGSSAILAFTLKSKKSPICLYCPKTQPKSPCLIPATD